MITIITEIKGKLEFGKFSTVWKAFDCFLDDLLQIVVRLELNTYRNTQ